MTALRPAEHYRRLRTDPDARRILHARDAVLTAVRRTLHRAGHLEIDTPLLQRITRPDPGRSFRTHTHHLPPDTYLRSSTLHLRGMLTAGVERVFEVGRRFRDEPADATHLPEHTLVEVYRAHATYDDMADLVQEIITAAATAALGTTRLGQGDTAVNLSQPFARAGLHQVLTEATGTAVTPSTGVEDLRALARAHDVKIAPDTTADLALLDLYEHLAEPGLVQPMLVDDFPAAPSALAAPVAADPRLAQKWDLVIGGVEVATAYTELVDPAELGRRLAPPADGSPAPAEAAGVDDAFAEVFASEHTTMPPAAGLCIGLDRLVRLLTGAPTVSAVLPFGGVL